MNQTTTVAVGLAPRGRSVAFDVVLVVVGSIVVALAAQLAIPLPFTTVPITAQTLAVLLVGAALGWKRGSAALVLYLAEGAAGLPVFAGAMAGPTHLFGSTGGYLFGFVAAAALVGWLAERRWCASVVGALAAMALGTAVIFICGVAWLAAMLGPAAAVQAGLVPFIPGAVLKIAAGAVAAPVARRLLARLGALIGLQSDFTQ